MPQTHTFIQRVGDRSRQRSRTESPAGGAALLVFGLELFADSTALVLEDEGTGAHITAEKKLPCRIFPLGRYLRA